MLSFVSSVLGAAKDVWICGVQKRRMKRFDCVLAKHLLRAWLMKIYVYFELWQVLKFSNYFSRTLQMFLFFNIFPLIVVFINNVMKEEVIFLLVFHVPQKSYTFCYRGIFPCPDYWISVTYSDSDLNLVFTVISLYVDAQNKMIPQVFSRVTNADISTCPCSLCTSAPEAWWSLLNFL